MVYKWFLLVSCVAGYIYILYIVVKIPYARHMKPLKNKGKMHFPSCKIQVSKIHVTFLKNPVKSRATDVFYGKAKNCRFMCPPICIWNSDYKYRMQNRICLLKKSNLCNYRWKFLKVIRTDRYDSWTGRFITCRCCQPDTTSAIIN